MLISHDIKYYVGIVIHPSHNSYLDFNLKKENLYNSSQNDFYNFALNLTTQLSFPFDFHQFIELDLSNLFSDDGKMWPVILDKFAKNNQSKLKLSIVIPQFMLNFDNIILHREITNNQKNQVVWNNSVDEEKDFKIFKKNSNDLVIFLNSLQSLKKDILSLIIKIPKQMTLNDGRHLLNFLLKICDSYGFKTCVEFLNTSWFQELSFNLLKKYNSAMILSDNNSQYHSFSIATSNFIYLRIDDKRKINWWSEKLEKRVDQELCDRRKVLDIKKNKDKKSIIDFIAISCSNSLVREQISENLGPGNGSDKIKISNDDKSSLYGKKSQNPNNIYDGLDKVQISHHKKNKNKDNIDNISDWQGQSIVIHVDLNSFYSSCEELRDPILKGKPHAVVMTDQQGNQTITRGVIASCSYEAKKFGVQSAMPLSSAIKLCPILLLKKTDMVFYRKISNTVMNILENYADVLEQASIDEAYLDSTEKVKNFSTVTSLNDYGLLIKKSILKDTGLLCSIGIAKNKSVAKIASDFEKPDGLTVVPPKQTTKFLYDLEVERISGVGTKTQKLLSELNIKTIGQLAKMDIQILIEKFGKKTGVMLWMIANGQEQVEVKTREGHVSLSTERSLIEFTLDKDILLQTLYSLAEDLYQRIQKEKYQFKTVGIKLVKKDFTSETREVSFRKYQNSLTEIVKVIPELLDKFELLSNSENKNYVLKRDDMIYVKVTDIATLDKDIFEEKLVGQEEYIKQSRVRKIGLKVSSLERIQSVKELNQKSIQDYF